MWLARGNFFAEKTHASDNVGGTQGKKLKNPLILYSNYKKPTFFIFLKEKNQNV
jgi:hypothetical protein